MNVSRRVCLAAGLCVLLSVRAFCTTPESGESVAASQARIEALLVDLGSLRFEQRDAAQKKLGELPASAIPALKAHLDSDDPEIRFRIPEIIDTIRERFPDLDLLLNKRLGNTGRYKTTINDQGVVVVTITHPEDLVKLSEFPIQQLVVDGAGKGGRTIDLTPLQGMPLQQLDLRYLHPTTLLALKDMELTRLVITHASHLTDISILEHMPLEHLALDRLNIDPSRILKPLPLKQLSLFCVPIQSLECLRGKRLHTLNIQGSAVTDLSPLSEMPLTALTCDTELLRQFEATVRSLPSLEQLNAMAPEPFWREANFHKNARKAFIAMGGHPEGAWWARREYYATAFAAYGPAVTNLAPLKGEGYTELYVPYTRVSDLSPLTGMPLKRLSIEGTDVTDLGPLKNMRLIQIMFSPSRIKEGISALREMKTLKNINNRPPSLFWTQWDEGVVAIEEALGQRYSDAPMLTREKGRQTYRLNVHACSLSRLPDFSSIRLRQVVLRNSQVSDLSPLAGMPLELLDVAGSPVEALDLLKGMDLRHINLSSTEVEAIGVLEGMALQALSLAHTRVSDLSVIAGMPLSKLDVARTPVRRFSVLSSLQLAELDLQGTPITDLGCLAHMTRLTRLDISQTAVSNLAPLAGMRIQDLRLNGTKVADLTPLEGMPLRNLEIMHTPVNSLAACSRSPIEVLRIDGSAVQSMTPIEDLPLQHVTCSEEQEEAVRNATAAKQRLRSLNNRRMNSPPPMSKDLAKVVRDNGGRLKRETMGSNRVNRVILKSWKGKDLSALEGANAWCLEIGPRSVASLRGLNRMPLKTLIIHDSGINDFTPLRGTALETLDLRGCAISDLSPLEGMPLRSLDLSDTEVTHIALLGALPLKKLVLNYTAVTDLTPLKGMKIQDLSLRGVRAKAGWEVLSTLPLERLDIRDTSLDDLSLLKGLQLDRLELSASLINPDPGALRELEVSYINGLPAERFWREQKEQGER